MPVPVTTKTQFCEHLDALGIAVGDAICVHSRMLSFGRVEGGAHMMRDALLAAVGPSGTVAMPTFTFNVTSNTIFDPITTPPYLVGALSESLLAHPAARRTCCPIHSFAAIGPQTEALMAADPCRPLGPASAFEAMWREGFKLVLLGCTYTEGGTYVHHVEAKIGVPYREWITIPRQVRDANGNVAVLMIRYYGKAAGAPAENDLRPVERAVEAAGEGRFAPLTGSKRRSHIIELGILEARVQAVVAENPYALVVRRSEVHDGSA